MAATGAGGTNGGGAMRGAARWDERSRFLVAPAALVVLWAGFSLFNPYFFGLSNFLNVAGQFSLLLIVSLGEMIVIVARGFDISVGAVAALASVAAALAVNAVGPWGLLAAPLAGLACGMTNGLLVAYGRVQPIISTIGMLSFARGLALWLGGNEQAVMLTRSDGSLQFAYRSFAGVPLPFFAALAAALAAALLLYRTRLGRRIYMVGSNPGSAELVGVPVRATVAASYALCGLAAGSAGALYLSRASAGLSTEGAGLELQAIASAVIGGTALTGGVGNPAAVVAGAFFIQSLFNGLNMSGASPFAANLAMGGVIAVAGLLDFALRRMTGTGNPATGGGSP